MDFDAGNQKYVTTKCLNKLFDRHKIYDELVYPRIEYRSDHDYYINTVDLKTKRVRSKMFISYIKLGSSSLSPKIKGDYLYLTKLLGKGP